MVFRSPVERAWPPQVAPEREALAGQLDFHRATILMKLDGLDDEQASTPMVPSGVSLLALLKHLTEVEHGWFVKIFAGLDEPDLYARDDDIRAEWRVDPGDTTEGVAQAYLAAVQRSRDIVAAAASLDALATTPWGEQIDLRGIMIHMIEETARHNGHADIIRELIDGATGA
jgi:uncharacterized damage-inducible protein DinB